MNSSTNFSFKDFFTRDKHARSYKEAPEVGPDENFKDSRYENMIVAHLTRGRVMLLY